MSDNKLLASVALFSELYDNNKDIYDVIAELLKAVFVLEKKWEFNASEATQYLEDVFGFHIPEAVVKTTLRNRLKRDYKVLDEKDGGYYVIDEDLKKSNPLSGQLSSAKGVQKKIVEGLVDFIEKRLHQSLADVEKQDIENEFCDYLLDNSSRQRYSDLISSYIIANKDQSDFTKNLNAIREGLVIYDGIRYSPNLADIGTWKKDITIYLDTEHLFNVAGYNGELYKNLFGEFYGLVKEVNQKKNGKISLEYFDECESEVHNIFHVCELIVDGKVRPDPSKTAIQNILNGSGTKSDIATKKAKLFSLLEKKRIFKVNRDDFYDEYQYVVEGGELIQSLKKEAEENNRQFDEEKCKNALKLFTKINALRKGENKRSFEDIGHILMTGNSVTQYLAFHPKIRENDGSIPYATDIDFITNRLWFKLNKGLSNDSKIPLSFDVVIKAQVVLASHINSSVSEKFDQLKEQYDQRKLSAEEAEYLHKELRSKSATPEEITATDIDDALSFLGNKEIESHIREKSLLEKKAYEGEKAIKELQSIKENERSALVIKKQRNIMILFWCLAILLVSIIIGLYGVVVYLLIEIQGGNKNVLAVLGVFISFFAATSPIAYSKKIIAYLMDKYRSMIASARKVAER
ncbi:hypothetical protein [Thiohalophilus thiocyanatoxydans]|uniref:Uncharacterized protein n=1 Tax=Thiohalophilus thiocyanatoxydans TaxID=381308 RepID=A0A4R8IGG1_9GAMM|nr:hypothetical protein [Thiohalophilus thiocyanatoxydans]TDX99661.1 hypothetical protein EDC23_2448 [Thiohalophilus thiocyanatoxydans]